MEVSYKRDFHHNYLILKNQELPDCDAYDVRMLLHSSVPGLLPCSVHKFDNQAFFYYEITSRQTLASLYETQKMDKEILVLLTGALIRTIEEMESYLLRPEYLILNPDYIYMNAGDRRIGFVYWPGEEGERGDFLQLTEYLLQKIDHQDQDAVVLGYQLYRRALEDQINPEEIRRELYQETLHPDLTEKKPLPRESIPEIDVEKVCGEYQSRQEVLEKVLKNVQDDEKKEPGSRMGVCMAGILFLGVLYLYLIRNQYFSWIVFAVIAGVCAAGSCVVFVIWRKKRDGKKPNGEVPVKEKSISLPVNRSETELPDIMEEAQTTLLFAESEEWQAKLKAVNPEGMQDISLKKGTIILGKMAGTVDVVLPSSAVSRVHAKIKWDGECTVFDLNSKNGTYVNCKNVIGSEGVKLTQGDLVTFADLVYQYTTKGSDLHLKKESTIMMEDHYRRHENGAAGLQE